MQYLVKNITQNSWLESFNELDQSPNWVSRKEDAKRYATIDVAKTARKNALEYDTKQDPMVLNVIKISADYEPKYPTFRSVENKMNKDTHDGWCFFCGEWTHHSCEPDARQYKCPKCENNTVYGAEEIIITARFK